MSRAVHCARVAHARVREMRLGAAVCTRVCGLGAGHRTDPRDGLGAAGRCAGCRLGWRRVQGGTLAARPRA